MSFKYPFLKVLSDLQSKNIDPILVGGWVPTVYFEYYWKTEHQNILTNDIDLALTPEMKPKATIEESFKNNNAYKRRHLNLGKERPYKLLFEGKIPIDFLTDDKFYADIHSDVLGEGIILDHFDHYSFLTTDTISVECDGLKVRVPDLSRYIAHKLHVYFEKPRERKRDIAIAYYCLSRSPEQDGIYSNFDKIDPQNSVIQSIHSSMGDMIKSTSSFVQDVYSVLSKEFGAYEDVESIAWHFNRLFEFSNHSEL